FRFQDGRVSFQRGAQNRLERHPARGVRTIHGQYRDEEFGDGEAPQVPKKNNSSLHRWPNFAGGRATSAACVALRFAFLALSSFDPKSSASAELAQVCARRASSALCK